MSRNNFWVSPHDDGWAIQRENSGRASRVVRTQREAENLGRKFLKRSGGGEMITQNTQGEIRSKDTIAKPDPFPPKDWEH